MELRHLQYFIAVAEELHFGKAARRLNMTQPPLSQQIKQLEEEVGVTLLKRTKRFVELTAAGEIFLNHCRMALMQIGQGIELAQRTARGEQGLLVIGFVGSATYEFLPPIVREYRKKFPSVKIELREISSSRQQEELLKGNIDIGLQKIKIIVTKKASNVNMPVNSIIYFTSLSFIFKIKLMSCAY